MNSLESINQRQYNTTRHPQQSNTAHEMQGQMLSYREGIGTWAARYRYCTASPGVSASSVFPAASGFCIYPARIESVCICTVVYRM